MLLHGVLEINRSIHVGGKRALAQGHKDQRAEVNLLNTAQFSHYLPLGAAWLGCCPCGQAQREIQSEPVRLLLPDAPGPQGEAFPTVSIPPSSPQLQAAESQQKDPDIQSDVHVKEVSATGPTDLWHRKYLFGDWNGKRSAACVKSGGSGNCTCNDRRDMVPEGTQGSEAVEQ